MLKQFNIEKIISKLKEKRSILVSEADLQLEMALIIKVGQDKYNPEAYSANGGIDEELEIEYVKE